MDNFNEQFYESIVALWSWSLAGAAPLWSMAQLAPALPVQNGRIQCPLRPASKGMELQEFEKNQDSAGSSPT